MADKDKGAFDLGAIRTILEQDANKYLKGVCNNDVDWFLRDSNINSEGAPTPTPEKEAQPLAAVESPRSAATPSKPPAANGARLSPVSSHLQTSISNANDHYPSKTRPTVAPIAEEPVEQALANQARTGRSRSSSSPAMPQRRRSASSSGGGGFFSKLKGKFHRSEDLGPASPRAQSPSPPGSASPSAHAPTGAPLFKDDYKMEALKHTSSVLAPHAPATKAPDGYSITRTMSTPNYLAVSDPRLDEYISFYKQKDLRRRSTINSSRRSSVLTAAGSNGNADHLDIPTHPRDSPLPSALVNGFDNTTYNKHTAPHPLLQLPPPSKFASFLKRRASVVNGPESRRGSDVASIVSPTPSSSSAARANSSETTVPELADLRPLKRVAFHALTFLIDPPQQIPSRKPRKGNVEVLPNGELKINPLSEEEKEAISKSQMGQGGGIVVGGTGALNVVQKADEHTSQEPPAVDDNGNVEEDTKIDRHARLLGIDKPMISHHSSATYNAPPQKMALDLMYTRCCHLREILPIPAILKQIPPGSMNPIPLLQMRNPTPTMVEIQTFADFVRIAPVVCVSLDGVSLSFEQFKVVLSAMAAKKQLEKLSLRNTPIDSEGWSLLCWFLSRNTVINKLDITQCPSLLVNLLKKKKRKAGDKPNTHESTLARMSCNKENRSDMDWELFIATLVARGGIEELILTGCCIVDTDVFGNLVKLAMLIRTSRLGLAYNNLSVGHMKILVDHWLFKPFARGLDLGYNDFSSIQFLNIILKKRQEPGFYSRLQATTLGFFSLNATNLRFTETFKEFVETILLRMPNLKYLDLSNNPKLFGQMPKDQEKSTESVASSSSLVSVPGNGALSQDAIVSYVTSKLPLFPRLIRFHLENNDLSSNSLVSIAKTLPFCKNLGYFSVVGNDLDLAAATALIQALENSKTLITLDCDTDSLPTLLKEKIGLYTMRNMERILYSSKNNVMPADGDEAVLASNSPSSLTEQLNVILARKANNKLDLKDPEVQSFITRARKIRNDLRSSMSELYRLQLRNELNVEGKEMLIRFVFIESSIERGLQLIDPSLVDPKDSFSLSELQRNSAEGNVTSHDGALAEADTTDPHENNSLHITQANTPLNMSRNSSKTNLSSLDKQEGSAFKLRKIHQGLKEKLNNAGEERGFLADFENVSGEDIRNDLKEADLTQLDRIITYLDELKEKKIPLEAVFNQKSRASDGDDLQTRLATLQATLQGLASKSGSTDKPADGAPDAPPAAPPHDGKSDDRAVLETYNSVLSEIAKGHQ